MRVDHSIKMALGPKGIKFSNSKSGFSLIELTISVAIIGMLAAMGSVSYQQFVVHSRYGRAKTEMAGMLTLISGLRVTESKTLIQLTGSICTAQFIMGTWGAPSDASTWNAATSVPSWVNLGYTAAPIDPWGHLYVMDENEGEFSPADCRNDSIWTAGQDGLFAGPGDGTGVGGDDLLMSIPLFQCPNQNPPLFQGGQ